MKGLLDRAVESQQMLEMIYIANDNQLSQRIIKVLKVTDDSIKAYCNTKRQFRTFKLDNILSVLTCLETNGGINDGYI